MDIYGFSFVPLTRILMECSPVNLTVELFHWAQSGSPRPGLAWSGLAWLRRAGIDHAGACVLGSTSTKIMFSLKNNVLGVFWLFLDLLDFKNGSGSKFYAGKWYREVWKPKINLFRDKTMNL